MAFQKICEYCDASFTSNGRQARFCSLRCSSRAHGPSRSAHYSAIRPSGCASPGCDEPRVPQGDRKRAPRLCRTHEKIEKAIRRPRTCEVCNSAYVPTYSQQRTCSRQCGAEINGRVAQLRSTVHLPRPKPVRSRPCKECGASIAQARTTVCSEACRKARRNRAERASRLVGRATPALSRCGACGAEVPSRRKRCEACLEQTRWRRKHNERVRRRARDKQVKRERYTLAEIAERDRFRCGLCRKRVPMTRAVPHPKAPTIDHVVPLSISLDDTRANVQLAHFECNWRKADGGSQQLALIG